MQQTIPRVDPLTHSLVGATLARTGLHRATPLATATLVLAANAPDIDVLVALRGSYVSLALRRGITHGPLALVALPVLVLLVVLWYDRRRRRRRDPAAPPARAAPVLALAALGVATHAPLDWLNTYGVRLLSPLDGRWFYGDALFIIDPWLWLLLAAGVVPHTRTRVGRIAWLALGIAGIVLVSLAPVALGAKILFALAVLALAIATMRVSPHDDRAPERRARSALAAAGVYIVAMIAADAAARNDVTRAAAQRGLAIEELMVAPLPANPFAGDIVVRTASAYQLGQHRWIGDPRIRWSDSIPLGPRHEVVLETLRLRPVRNFLRWSRFPYVTVTEDDGGHLVRWGDARYPETIRGGLSGVTVRVDVTPQAPAR